MCPTILKYILVSNVQYFSPHCVKLSEITIIHLTSDPKLLNVSTESLQAESV